MNRVVRAIRGSRGKRWLLMQASSLVCLVRLALYVLPFKSVVDLCKSLLTTTRRPSTKVAAEHAAWAVDVTARALPLDATCLVTAIAAQILCHWYGHRTEVCVGGAQSAGTGFAAHAWLEKDGQVILGGVTSPQEFCRILVLS